MVDELVPLVLTYECCVTADNVERNIRATLQRDYQKFNPLLCDAHDKTISIAGFAPSLTRTWTQLDGDILACNGAHNWLIDRGVIPKFGMFWDAAEVVSKFVRPHKEVIYLVASRCHQSVFDALDGFNVIVWHAKGDVCLDDLLVEYNRMEPMIHGGSAAVTRAMVLARPMGYRKIKLFGCDSSYEEETHVEKSVVAEQPLQVFCNGRMFQSTPWLAGQAEDFKTLAPQLKSIGCDISVYGDGLIPHLARYHGFKVFDSPPAA